MEPKDSTSLISWVFDFLKTHKYCFYAPLVVGGIIFMCLGKVFGSLHPAIALVLLELVCCIFWFLFLIYIPRFKKDEIGILVVFPTVPKLYEEVKSISDELSRLIQGLSIGEKIKVKVTRNNLFLNNSQAIENILVKKCATLIVYAEFQQDTKNNDLLCHFRQIQFVTRFPRGIVSLQKDMERDFQKIHAGYSLKDTFGKRSKVIEDITIIATFTLSNALRAFGNITVAQELLTELRRKYLQTRNSIAIKKNIAFCLLAHAHQIYEKEIYQGGNKFNIDHAKLEEIRQILITAYNSFYEYRDIFMLLAIINFLLGEIKKSRSNLQRVLSRTSKHNYIANFSYAFLDCYENRVLNAKTHWDKFYTDPEADIPNMYSIWHMINFTESVLERYPERYALYFHLANIYRMLDLNIALEKMNLFLEQASLHGDAQKILEMASQETAVYKKLLEHN